MTAPLYAIGRFCSRHHYPTIAVWVVAAIVLIVAGQASGDKTNDNLTLPGTGSTQATELMEEKLPEQAYGSNPLAFESKAGPLTQPKYAAAIEESIKRLNAMHEVNSAISPLSHQGVEAGLLSKDKTVAYTPVVLGVGPGELTEEQAQAVLERGRPGQKGRARDLDRQLRRPAALQARHRGSATRSGSLPRSSSCSSPSAPRRR